MAVLQALLALLERSLGTILEALFGWAVLAVFGRVSRGDKARFSAAVGAAAAWPILLAGIVWPAPVALVVALLPIPKGTPQIVIRGVWILLAAAVPIFVGAVLGRAPKGQRLSPGRRLLSGFAVTAALAAAFLIVCVAVPVRRLRAALAGMRHGDVALLSPPGGYREIAAEVLAALRRAGFELESVPPPWHMRALSRLMRTLGGRFVEGSVPERLEVIRGDGLEITLYPAGATILASAKDVARSQAVIAELAPRTGALQTTSVAAQKVENRIRDLWKAKSKSRRAAEDPVRGRLGEIFEEIAALDADYEDWEVVYRQALQLAVDANGGSKLLERAVRRSSGVSRGAHVGRTRRIGRKAGSYARGRFFSSAPKEIADLAQRLAGRWLKGRRFRR